MKPDHPQINFGKTGVLLINLGTQTNKLVGHKEIFKRVSF